MPGTLIGKAAGNKLLKEYLATHSMKIASSIDDLYRHSVCDDNGEEVDEFLRSRKERRSEDDESHRRID